MPASKDEPHERRARPTGRASFQITAVDPGDPILLETLRAWDWVTRSLLARGVVAATTRQSLKDSQRIVGELQRVLVGDEPGEGTAEERRVLIATRANTVQAIATTFDCPRAVFVELIATAPWNLLGAGDPPDARTVHGAGRAMLDGVERHARDVGLGGRVALQAENARALAVYAHLGFEPMLPSDAPPTLVPKGEKGGWSDPVVRLARKESVEADLATPWLLRDPSRPVIVRRPRRTGSPPAQVKAAR